jgi:hypothetical protein
MQRPRLAQLINLGVIQQMSLTLPHINCKTYSNQPLFFRTTKWVGAEE